jgi:hypothetical protein
MALFRHAEIGRPVGNEHVVFLERPRIEQHFDTLTRRELTLGMLAGDTLFAAPGARTASTIFQLFQD